MLFPLSNGDYKGILNYTGNYDIPNISINAISENSGKSTYTDIDCFIHHKPTDFTAYYKDGTDPIHIVFDFYFFGVKITNYLIETGNIGSPPTKWIIAGSNNKQGPWTNIDDPPFNDSLCPKVSGAECNQRTITRWNCSSSSAFRYIRFSIISDRRNSQANRYLRLGGLEFYGTLLSPKYFNSCHIYRRYSISSVYFVILLSS